MEQQVIGWREQQLARRIIGLARQSGAMRRYMESAGLSALFDRLGRQLAERGIEVRNRSALAGSFAALLRKLAAAHGRRAQCKYRLPPVDAELLATLMEICDWMTRLERPAWRIERARCVICGRNRSVPRIMKLEWLSMHMDEHQDRVAGVLIGLAAGDENGGPTEMALRLAQSLLACNRYDADDVFDRYLEWHRQGSYDTGPVAGRVLALGLEGMPAEAAAAKVDTELEGMTAGCNAAHRAGVLAMAPWLDTERLVAAARREAGLTHRHPVAADAAVAIAISCHDRIMGRGWGIGRARRIAPLLHKEIARGLGPASSNEPPSAAEAARHLSRDGYSPNALRAGLYFAKQANDPVEALAESKKFAGPANYCPVLTGALLGASFGASACDDSSLGHQPAEHIAEIKAVAWGLARIWRFSPPRAGGRGGSNQDRRKEVRSSGS